MGFERFSAELSRPPKMLLSPSSSFFVFFFFNLGSWGRWEPEIKPALMKLSNSKFTNSGFSLQFSRHSIIRPTAAEVWFLRARWGRLFTSIVPSNPLFKLHFPRKGGGVTGIRACARRALGWSQAAGRGAEAPEPSDSCEPRESAEGRGQERRAGLTTGRRPHCA